jgi:methionyl-tRNA synthetase
VVEYVTRSAIGVRGPSRAYCGTHDSEHHLTPGTVREPIPFLHLRTLSNARNGAPYCRACAAANPQHTYEEGSAHSDGDRCDACGKDARFEEARPNLPVEHVTCKIF